MVTFTEIEAQKNRNHKRDIMMRKKAKESAKRMARFARENEMANAREQRAVLSIVKKEADAATRQAYGKGQKAQDYMNIYSNDPVELARRYETLTQKIKSGEKIAPVVFDDDLESIKNRTHSEVRWGEKYEALDKAFVIRNVVRPKAEHLGIAPSRLPGLETSEEYQKEYIELNDKINKHREALSPLSNLSPSERLSALKAVEELRVPPEVHEKPLPRVAKLHYITDYD